MIIKIIYILFLINTFLLNAYSLPSNEKPTFETYKLSEFPERQNIIKFLNSGLIISDQCVFSKNKKFTIRKCEAWKPIEAIESGKFKKYFHPNKVLPDPNNPRLVSLFICIQSGGSVATEVNEYGKYGRDVEPMDFCQYKDNSLLALSSIERFLKNLSSK